MTKTGNTSAREKRYLMKTETPAKVVSKNEEIDLLKMGLSGIAKRYGFQTVHDFYKTFAVSKTANAEYWDKADRWEEKYGENTGDRKKKAYISGYRIIKEEKRTDKRNRLQKAGIGWRGDYCPSRFYNICSTAVKYLYIYLLCCRFSILDILNEPFKY